MKQRFWVGHTLEGNRVQVNLDKVSGYETDGVTFTLFMDYTWLCYFKIEQLEGFVALWKAWYER